MAVWQQEYNSNPEVQKLSKSFDKFTTIDWPLERLTENRKYYEALKRRAVSGPADAIDLNVEEGLLESDRPGTAATNGSTSMGTLHSLNTAAYSAMSIISEISNLQLIKSRIWTTVQIWLVLTITGIVVGSIAAFLSVLTEWLNSFKMGYCASNFFLDEKSCLNEDWRHWSSFGFVSFIIFTVLSVLYGVFAAFQCLYVAPNAAGSGISEVKCIVAGFNRPDFLSPSTLIIKALALPFTIASGLAVGKEGPSVHYASCVGNVVARWVVPWFNESPLQLSDIITAGAGSGVAVAFGSPIGGVLFSIEEISSGLRLNTLWKIFYTSLVAITTLQIWNPFGTGQIVMFEVRYDSDWIWSEIVWFIILGIFGGLYGIVISKWNIKYVAFRQRYLSNWKFSGPFEVFWLCLFSAIVGYWNIYMRLDMTKVMEMLFDSCRGNEGKTDNAICLISQNGSDTTIAKWLWTLFTLFYATIVRMILVCISYGSKVPCGIFVPSMAVGATFGKMLGLLVEEILGKTVDGDGNVIGVPSGTYAFLGAGAALSGITGLTFTVVVIMYELTGAIKYIIPTMITIVSVRIVSELGGIGFGGIADQMIKFNGLPFIDTKEEHELGEAVTVGDVMVPKVVGLDCEGMYERDILKIMEFEKREYPLLYKRRCVVGVISHADLLEIFECLRREKPIDGIVEDGQEAFDLGNQFVRFISKKKMRELSQVVGEEIEYGQYNQHFGRGTDNDGGSGDGEWDFEEYVGFEVLSINMNTSVYTLFDLFVEVGSRIVFVYDRRNVVGIVSRKDLIRYENYIHYKEHGDVFVNGNDVVLFQKLWTVYTAAWRILKFWDRERPGDTEGRGSQYLNLRSE